MGMGDLFKKSEDAKTEETKTEETKQEESQESQVDQEEDFEAKSARLSAAVETARDGMDLGDIPARDDHPYHLAVKEHRLHELKRKK